MRRAGMAVSAFDIVGGPLRSISAQSRQRLSKETRFRTGPRPGPLRRGRKDFAAPAQRPSTAGRAIDRRPEGS